MFESPSAISCARARSLAARPNERSEASYLTSAVESPSHCLLNRRKSSAPMIRKSTLGNQTSSSGMNLAHWPASCRR